MTDKPTTSRVPLAPPLGAFDVVASMLVAFTFAVAQPLLDLLGRNAEFFVVRDSPRLDLVLLALALTILVPLAGAGAVLLARRVRPSLGNALHGIAIAGLAGAFVLQIVKRAPLPGPLLVLGSLVAGATVAVAYFRARPLRLFMRIASPGALAVAALFLLASPASKLLRDVEARATVVREIARPTPLVMVVLDEFPVASLMDPSGDIDARLFPSFARLARRATWYRNATTVHDFTNRAVPALLTGRLAGNDKLPILREYPENLFTLLAPHYDMHVIENVTKMCPAAACGAPANRKRPVTRWRLMLADLRWVGLHMLAPPDLAERLPAVDQTWGNFGRGDAPRAAPKAAPPGAAQRGAPARAAPGRKPNRSAVFDRFLASIRRSPAAARPGLWFLHSMLPHPAWEYLPDGRVYPQTGSRPGHAQGRAWKGDDWLAWLSYQRHLEQVRFVDRLIGELVRRLESEGLFDDSMIVITSDHGAAFDGEVSRRAATPETVGGIAAVPLFIKTPGQRRGGADDRPVETIDVLPTVAGVVGIRGMPPTEGVSLLDGSGPKRAQKTLLTAKGERLVFDASGREKYQVVQRKYRLFAARGSSLDPYAVGPYRALVGRPVRDLALGAPRGSPTAVINSRDAYTAVDLRASSIPALMTGRLEGVPPRRTVWIAVALNGTIASVTRTFREGPHPAAFDAFLAPQRFRQGRNTVQLLLVESRGGTVSLSPLR